MAALEEAAAKKGKYTYYQMADIVERMVSMNSMNAPVNYGDGVFYNSKEVHTLSYIVDYPGISPSEIAYNWNRTKGAVSQIVKKLEEKGLIKREKRPGNDKTICLYATDQGMKVDQIHRAYDVRNYKAFLELMKKHFTEDEIETSFEVMDKWVELSRDWIPH